MGAAIRHAVSILEKVRSKVRLLLIIGDGFPNDTGYKQNYAIKDTRMAILEADSKNIHAQALTINLPGDYTRLDDLFGHRGISKTHHSVFNPESIEAMINFMKEDFTGLLFANLIEFDMTYGHRNDPTGYAQKLEEFDAYIPKIRAIMKPTDICMIVADHGVDPTTKSTDHSREYIPLLVFGPDVKNNVDLGIRQTFADVAATIADALSVTPPLIGTSFLKEITD